MVEHSVSKLIAPHRNTSGMVKAAGSQTRCAPSPTAFYCSRFGAAPADEAAAQVLPSRIADAIKRHLRLELLNRISRTVVFNPLSKENVREIADKFIARLNARLRDQGLRLTLDESA